MSRIRRALVSRCPTSTFSPRAWMIAVRRSDCSWRRRRRRISGVAMTPPACTSSSRRATSAPRDGASSMKKSTAEPTASAMRTRARISTVERSDVDVDDLADPEISDDLHHGRHAEEEPPQRAVEHQAAVLRIEQIDDRPDDDGKRREHVPAHAALRRVDAQLPADGEAGPDHRGEVVEHFGEVAADLALDEDRRYQDTNVHDVDPIGEVLNRVVEGHAEAMLL